VKWENKENSTNLNKSDELQQIRQQIRQISTKSDNFLTKSDTSQQNPTHFNKIRQILTKSDKFNQISTKSDKFQQNQTHLNKIRQISTKSDKF